jgi:hypothetical protein
MFEHVRQFLEATSTPTATAAASSIKVIGGFISPSHDVYLASKMFATPKAHLSATHRLALCDLASICYVYHVYLHVAAILTHGNALKY